ncbi:MAG: DUF3892 domain-containing protein [Deltaproteobacteria bacterium]|nr:DUF3892 domain-containing protein [Deltaproteobacteria bacterium]
MYSRAIKGGRQRVIYIDGNDRLVKIGGDPAWRNNNPGNLKSGAHTRIHGSIGVANGFTVFPSEEIGTEARVRLLKGSKYRNMTIIEAVRSYAPKKDGNNPERYVRQIESIAGLKRNRVLKDLSNDEFAALVAAMKQIEGNKPGREEKFRVKEIIDIRVNKRNVIIAYNVEDYGWLSKAETIALIEEGRIDAVVVSESGSTYIRTRPDQASSNNLEEMKPRK